MILTNPLDEKHSLGFLSPFFYSNLQYKGKCFPNVYKLSRVIGYSEAYRALLKQYPLYMTKIRDVKLVILGEVVDLPKICSEIQKYYQKKADENIDIEKGLIGYQKIINMALEKECLAEPSEDLILEIMLQNGMKKWIEYLEKDMTKKLTKNDVRRILDLPYDFKVNRILYHLSHYKKTPSNYECRKGSFSFRKGPFLNPMKKEEFVEWIKRSGLEQDQIQKVIGDPKSYSMYEILLYQKMK